MVGEDESDADNRSVSSASTIVTDNDYEYEWDELANQNGWEDLEPIPELDIPDEQDDIGVPVSLTSEGTTPILPELSR